MLQSITLNVQCIECSAQFSSLLPRFSLKCWSNSHLWPVTPLQCQDWPSRTHCWLLGVFDYLNQFVKTFVIAEVESLESFSTNGNPEYLSIIMM